MGLFDDINKAIGIDKNSKAKKLMRPPPKEKVRPTIDDYMNYANLQADLLFLPNDGGYRYALVVVDTTSRKADARPLKTKNPSEVLKGLKSIFAGKYLQLPGRALETDDGTEFKGSVDTYLDKKDIQHKVGRPGRSRQQGLVENVNKVIGKAIMTKQNDNELDTGVTDRGWIDLLPKIISAYNTYVSKTRPSVKERIKDMDTAKCSGSSCKLLEEGTRVHVILDKPKDAATGNKLHGKFRSGDLRFEERIRTITKVSLKPNQPVLYTISGIGNVLYTREQLRLASKEDQQEKAGNPDPDKKYVISKLVSRFKKGNRIYFKVKWKGYEKTSDEPRAGLMKEVPDLVKAYEKVKIK